MSSGICSGVAAVSLLAATASYLFFVVASTAITRSRVARLEELDAEGVFGARCAAMLVARSHDFLLYTQVGRFLSSTGIGFALAFLLASICQGGWLIAVAGAQYPGVLVATVVGVVVAVGSLVLVQVAKSFALQFPERCLCFAANPLRLSYPLVGPVVVLLHAAVAKVLGWFGVRPANEREVAISAEELSEIVKISSEAGALDPAEKELIEGVVELSEHVVREVMTPRKDVVWIKESARVDDLVRIFTREAVSRVLVCGTDLDDVKGIFLAKDLVRFVGRQVTPLVWRQYIRAAHFVPNTKPVDELLSELREKGIHLAVVLDEHGGVDGIVTLEDLVEEIIGEVLDEFDTPSDGALTVVRQDGAFIVDGAAPIADLISECGLELPSGDYDTVAGLILAHLGRVPAAGESFGVDGVEFSVLEVHKQRVARVCIRRVAEQEATGSPPGQEETPPHPVALES